MAGTDPLLRAVQTGDPRCPDGTALARLGRTVRSAAGEPSPELRDSVAQRVGADRDEDALIDAHFDRGRAEDPALTALAVLVARAARPPRRIDLASAVQQRLARGGASRRLATASGTAQLDAEGQRRVWWWVAAGHLAAALLLIVVQPSPQRSLADASAAVPPQAMAPESSGPASWADTTAESLLAARRTAVSRQQLAAAFGMGESVPAITGAVRWLVAAQTIGGADDGRFGPGIADAEQAVAVQASVILALLGEGEDDLGRASAIQRGLAWLERQPLPRTSRSGCLVAWCWTEAALQLHSDHARQQAIRHLAAIDPLSAGPTAAIGLLALELGRAGGLPIPERTLLKARRQIAQPLGDEQDPARLGSAAMIRIVLGMRELDSTRIALDRLVAGGAATTADPLAWFMPTLALREDGGERWTWWRAHRLQPVLDAMVETSRSTSMVPAHRVRWASEAGGDIAATAWSVLVLQAPYRTIPLRR